MNVLFLTISPLQRINYSGIYTDLMRKFRDEGHQVYIVSSVERRQGTPTNYKEVDGVHILSVKTLNLQKTNVVEKGVGQLLVETQYKKAIKKYLGGINFDLILYTTPPITFPKVISYLKGRNKQAKTYLLLKDIFPQNAVDIGMLQGMPVQGSRFKVQGWVARAKYQLYKYFRKKEVELYKLSDRIGCMSPANVEYLLKHNPFIDRGNVCVAPNSYEFKEYTVIDEIKKKEIREKYGLPIDKTVFIYGGNLGKPQGIAFLIDCLKDITLDKQLDERAYFLIVGKGTERQKLLTWYNEAKPNNVSVLDFIPKEDYDLLARSCDVGLIFLDYRFTIPNYPSRLLPYLKEKKPVIAATDPNTDVGTIAEKNGYGLWCPSNDVLSFVQCVKKMLQSDLVQMGENGYQFYKDNYTVEHTYNAIVSHV